MIFEKSRSFLFRLVAITLISGGFAQVSFAGVVGTEVLVEAEARSESLARIQSHLARADVAEQLQALGVDKADIDLRLAGLTSAELLELEDRMDQQLAGGDAVAVVGIVFIVLMILELVGVTDIFKSF